MEMKSWLTVAVVRLALKGAALVLLVLGMLALVPEGPQRAACLDALRGELGAVVDVLSK